LPPIRRAQPSRVGSPRAASVDPFRAVAISPQRTVGRRTVIIRRPAVRNPLKHVSRRIIQAESVWFVAPDAGCEDVAIVTREHMSRVGIARGRTLPLCLQEFPDEREINSVSVLASALFVVTPECLCSRAGSRDVFPLRFRQ